MIFIPLTTTVVGKDLANLPADAANDEHITMDRRSARAVLAGKNEMAAISTSYIESIRTKEIIGKGCFGIVYKGTNFALTRNFAIKTFKADLLWTLGRSFGRCSKCEGKISDGEKGETHFYCVRREADMKMAKLSCF